MPLIWFARQGRFLCESGIAAALGHEGHRRVLPSRGRWQKANFLGISGES